MLQYIYEMLKLLETKIGDGAKLRFEVIEENLVIRVEWRDFNFRAEKRLKWTDLSQIVDETATIIFLAQEFKALFEFKKEELRHGTKQR